MSQEKGLDLDALARFAEMHACCICPQSAEDTQHDCCPHDATFRALLREARAARKMREALQSIARVPLAPSERSAIILELQDFARQALAGEGD